jgi:hypothetical protein
VDDVRLSARKGELRVLGKGPDGGKLRTVPVHPELRPVLQAWFDERRGWPGAELVTIGLERAGGGVHLHPAAGAGPVMRLPEHAVLKGRVKVGHRRRWPRSPRIQDPVRRSSRQPADDQAHRLLLVNGLRLAEALGQPHLPHPTY